MANSDVKINVGVSGVAQFKQGMKESQAAVKNLEQQLKLNEAQLKKNGDEERYLQNKTELLTKQIEEQKNVVSKANQALQQMDRDGVSRTSVAFQNMQQQVYKASTQLTEMQAELAGVGDSGQEAADNVSEMNYQLNNISRNVSFENVVNGISKVTDGLEAAAKKAVELGRKLVQAMLSGGQWADDLQTTADKWEMSPEDVYRMRQTANLIDTDAETIFQARKKLTAAMGKEGDKETMGAFAALGINYLAGSDENIERVFWKAGEGLMQMEDKVARNEYATKLYGRSWEELIPIFKTGREAYEEMMGSWTWIGDEQFENLTKLDDESQKTRSAWENIQHTLEAAMAPAMTEIMVALQGMMSEFNKYLQSEEGQEMLSKLNEAVSGLFTELTSINPAEVIGKITGIFDSIKNGLNWLIENKQTVYDALKVIAGGFALLKLGELAANIGRIVSGLGSLFGGGKGSGNQTTGAPEQTTGTAAPSVSGTGTVLFDTIMGQLMATVAVAKEDARLKNWWKAGEGDVNKWTQFGVDQGYLTQEQAQQNIDFMAKMDELAAATKENTAAQEENSWMPEKSPFEENLQNYYAEPMDRMTQVAGEMTGQVGNMTQANADMTAAVTDLNNLPANLQAAITNAVIAGMNSVTIVINEGAVSAIGERVSYGWGGKVQAMTK